MAIGELLGRLRTLLRREEHQRQMREETALHLQMLVEEYRAQGMSEVEALRAAQHDFGSRNEIEEQFHAQAGLPLLESVAQDIRHGSRMLVKNPGFTVVSLLTLALGIGANTAIYSYVDATWLRPMQVPEPGRMVVVYSSGRQGATEVLEEESSYLDYLDVRAQTKTLEDVVAFEHRGAIIYRGNEATELLVDVVSPNYFTGLRVPAMLGRTFTEGESADYAPVVLGHSFWKSYFGADRNVIGREVRLSNATVTIAGVLPANFRGADSDMAPALFMPTTTWTHITGSRGEFTIRDNRRQTILARVRPGTPLATAKVELDAIAARLEATYPVADKGLLFTVKPESARRGEVSKRAGLMLLGISGMVILIACANIANLQMARTEGRRKEIATRLALGCSRPRIIRQLLTESVVLSSIGGVLALVFGYWMIRVLPHLFNSELTAVDYDFRLDLRVLLFTSGLTVLSALLFGLIPAVHASKVELAGAMKDAEMRLGGYGGISLRNLLVVSQVALAMVLLVSAGVLIRTEQNVRSIDPGFDSKQRLLLLNVVPGLGNRTEAQLGAYYTAVVDRLRALPGVNKVSLTLRMPFSPSGGGARETVAVQGVEPPPGQAGFEINDHVVGPSYFEVVGTNLLRGRDFDHTDTAQSSKVVIINESMARQFWPNLDPVGRQLEIVRRSRTTYNVIGVVQDTKWNALTEKNRPLIYLPLSQNMRGEMTILVGTKVEPSSLVGAARNELAVVDRSVPLLSAVTLGDYMETTVAAERNRAQLSSGFGLLGLGLAISGIYGVLAYYLTRRMREIGVRMALGARPGQVVRMVLGRGLRMTAAGVLVGALGAYGAKRLFEGLLYGVRAYDPVTVMVVTLVLVLVAMLATYVPARRATKVDPCIALRQE